MKKVFSDKKQLSAGDSDHARIKEGCLFKAVVYFTANSDDALDCLEGALRNATAGQDGEAPLIESYAIESISRKS